MKKLLIAIIVISSFLFSQALTKGWYNDSFEVPDVLWTDELEVLGGTPGVGKVLTDDGTGAGIAVWTTAAGFSDPMTTRGDIIYRNPSNITARLGLGANKYILQSDGTDLTWSEFLASEMDIVDGGGIIAATEVEAALQENRTAIDLNTAKNTNVPTELSVGTVGVNTVAITSDGGADDVTIPAALVGSAGLLTTAKWGEIETNNSKNTNVSTALTLDTPTATTVPINSDGSSPDITLIEATTSTAGLLGATKWDEIVANTLKNTNVSTDLSEGTSTETTVDVNSSDGNNATLVSASTSRAGLLTKAKWDEIEANTTKITTQWTTTGSDIYYNTGNVGIGTTNPDNVLTLKVNANNAFSIIEKDSEEQVFQFIISSDMADANAGGAIKIYDGNEVEKVHIDSRANQYTYFLANNVGIGTDNPSEKLEVEAGGGSDSATPPIIKINNSFVGNYDAIGQIVAALEFGSDDVSGGGAGTRAKITMESAVTTGAIMNMGFYTSSSDGVVTKRMFISGVNGNVGIDTDVPGSKLSINGGLHVGGASDAGDDNLLVDGTVRIGSDLRYPMLGYATGRNVIRSIQVRIEGLTDATELKVRAFDKFNSEAFTEEIIDTDTPTGGTNFDISADGETVTIKGSSETMVRYINSSIRANDTGNVYYVSVSEVGGKVTFVLSDVDGNMLDISSIANTKRIDVVIVYVTSS